MSGLDEQCIHSCDCCKEKSKCHEQFWDVKNKRGVIVGWLNPLAYLESRDRTDVVNIRVVLKPYLVAEAMKFIKRMDSISCHRCSKSYEKGTEVYNRFFRIAEEYLESVMT